MSLITNEQIELGIKDLIATYNGSNQYVTFADVLNAFPALASSYSQIDVIFGSGNLNPTYENTAGNIAQFAQQYLYQFDIDAVAMADNNATATEIYEFYIKKFTSALYALFASSQELGFHYGGFNPSANEISDIKMIPSFVTIATASSTDGGLPVDVTGSLKQPSMTFGQNLISKNVTSPTTVGWVDKYFTINTQLEAGGIYATSPELFDNATMITFGAFDWLGNVSGIKYANAKDTQTKPVYFGEWETTLGGSASKAHILNNGMSMYIGDASVGYVGIDINQTIPEAKETTTGTTTKVVTTTVSTIPIQTDLLGLIFTTAPILDLYPY